MFRVRTVSKTEWLHSIIANAQMFSGIFSHPADKISGFALMLARVWGSPHFREAIFQGFRAACPAERFTG